MGISLQEHFLQYGKEASFDQQLLERVLRGLLFEQKEYTMHCIVQVHVD